jgi:hypothetical protein
VLFGIRLNQSNKFLELNIITFVGVDGLEQQMNNFFILIKSEIPQKRQKLIEVDAPLPYWNLIFTFEVKHSESIKSVEVMSLR